MLPPPVIAPHSAAPSPRSGAERQLFEKARELEAAFLAEMLSFAGLGAAEGAFAGGIGEEQFASFLRAEQARLMVARGGIGLAEQIFQSLVEKPHE
ncbi:MAG: rod-binding protein [Paracoccaceae bacterium]